jgi:prophage regulatory protein
MPEHITSLLRLKSIIAPSGPICVSRSTWLAGVRSARFPKPVKLGPRISARREEIICKLTQRGIQHTASVAQPLAKVGGGK